MHFKLILFVILHIVGSISSMYACYIAMKLSWSILENSDYMLFHNAYETFLEIYCNKGKIIEWCLYIHTLIYDNMITVLPGDDTMNYVFFDKHFYTCI